MLNEEPEKPMNPQFYLSQVIGKPAEKEEINYAVENRKLQQKVLELTQKANSLQKEVYFVGGIMRK